MKLLSINNLLILIIFQIYFLQSMDNNCPPPQSAKKIIIKNILNPELIQQQLKALPKQKILKRDSNYNNLIHITVRELISQKDTAESYKKLLQDSKLLLKFLVTAGVKINEMNNDKKTPLRFIYDLGEVEKKDLMVLEVYLEYHLCADPNFYSLAPTWRWLKTTARQLSNCECMKTKQN